MKRPKILVVGSFVMDQIATTEVFPNEGQTVLGKSFAKAPGGKGANQAVQAARLGADVTMVGKIGRDANGAELKKTCDEAGINTDYVAYDDNEASGCAVIVLESKPGEQTKNRIIVLSGSNMTIKEEDVAFLRDSISEYDMVILQLEIPMEINELVAAYAGSAGVPVMLNPAPSAPLSDDLLKNLTYISPNEHEIADLTGIKIEHEGKNINMDQVKAACDALRKRGVDNVLVTLGESGAALVNEEGFSYAPCAQGVMAVDPTAAGDSFLGAFCTGVCCGWSYDEILRFANHTSAITVSNLGAMPSLPSLEDVEAYMKQKDMEVPDTSSLKKRR